jgi:hypothetical protein
LSWQPYIKILLQTLPINKKGRKDEDQNLKGFYLTSAICFAAIAFLEMVFLKYIPYEKDPEEEPIINVDNSVKTDLLHPQKQNGDITGLSLCYSETLIVVQHIKCKPIPSNENQISLTETIRLYLHFVFADVTNLF